MDSVRFQGMEQLILDWETPFITDVFVIPKTQSCQTYDKASYTQRKLIPGDSTDLF